MNLGVLVISFINDCLREFPKFYGVQLFSGVIWTLANFNTVGMIKLLGIGLNAVFSTITVLFVSWIIPRFGLFGIKPQIPNNPTLNYIGVFLNLIAIIIFFFVKLNENVKFCADLSVNNSEIKKSKLDKFYESLSSRNKKILGIILSVIAGIGYGLCGVPTLYIQSNYKDASQDFSDYLFSQACGAVFSNILIVFLYCIFERNMPVINPEAVLPGFLTGVLNGIGFFTNNLSNNSLSVAVTAPVTSVGPLAVSLIIALAYKEVKGKRNAFVLLVGTIITLAGSICSGLSLI